MEKRGTWKSIYQQCLLNKKKEKNHKKRRQKENVKNERIFLRTQAHFLSFAIFLPTSFVMRNKKLAKTFVSESTTKINFSGRQDKHSTCFRLIIVCNMFA
jgi:hypothetical protein